MKCYIDFYKFCPLLMQFLFFDNMMEVLITLIIYMYQIITMCHKDVQILFLNMK